MDFGGFRISWTVPCIPSSSEGYVSPPCFLGTSRGSPSSILCRFFERCTESSSVLAGNSVIWTNHPTREGEPLDELLQQNIRSYTKYVEMCCVGDGVQIPESTDLDTDGPRQF